MHHRRNFGRSSTKAEAETWSARFEERNLRRDTRCGAARKSKCGISPIAYEKSPAISKHLLTKPISEKARRELGRGEAGAHLPAQRSEIKRCTYLSTTLVTGR